MGDINTRKGREGMAENKYVKPIARIVHYPERPENYANVASKAAQIVHLGAKATRLLLFYASCANGFTPSRKLILDNTGILFENLSRTRTELIDKGLINYKSGQTLFVRWDRISIFAMLDEPIYTSQKDAAAMKAKDYNPYKPNVKKIKKPPRIRDMPEFCATKVLHPAPLTDAQERFLDFLEGCTEEEFNDIMGTHKQDAK